MKKPDGWCYTYAPGTDEWHGVFKSREAAAVIAFAEAETRPFFVARAQYIDPMKYAEVNADGLADRILERMEDDAESDYGGDDPPFALLEGAEEALASAIRAWVEEYVEPVGWSVVEGTVEEVRS